MRHLSHLGSVVLLTAAWLSSPAAAATLIAMDLSELVRSSEHVVLAKAGARTSRKAPKSGLIVTDVQLRVATSLKGKSKAGQTLVVTLLGGSIGDLALRVPGEASLPENQTAIVFLRRNQVGELNVTGMSQGVMQVRGDGDAALVMPGGVDAELVQHNDDGRLRPAPDALMQPMPMPTLISEIRRLAEQK